MTDTENQTDSSGEVVRLPLWKNALDKMRETGIGYGVVFDAKFFEEELRSKRDEMNFGLGMSAIRRELEKDGYYITGRGQKGNQFVIVPPESNANVMGSYARQALDALSRGFILGTNTRLDTLEKRDRDRHESLLAKMATRLALMKLPVGEARKLLK
jgi:hypothetical protein